MKRIALVLLLLAGCGGGGGSGSNGPSGKHVLFLNFEGQVLQGGTDDPVNNKSSLVTGTQTVAPYLNGVGTRTNQINALVSEVETILAPYDIAVTTTRPATAGYDMIVAGGHSADVGLGSGQLADSNVDCVPNPPHISLLFDDATGHVASLFVVASLAVSHAVPGSNKNGDCLCLSGANCTLSGAAACTIGGAGTAVDAGSPCPAPGGGSTMDENQLFLTQFGPHP